MGRPLNSRRFRAAWRGMEKGASVHKCPVSPQMAEDIKTLQAAGYTADQALKEAEKCGGVRPLAAGIESAAQVCAPSEEEEPPQQQTQVVRVSQDRAEVAAMHHGHAAREVSIGDQLADFGSSTFHDHEAQVKLVKKEGTKTINCPCGKKHEVPVAVYRPDSEGIRLALKSIELGLKTGRNGRGLPSGIARIKPDWSADFEERWKMDALKRSVTEALEWAVREGKMEVDVARELFEHIGHLSQQALSQQ